MIRGAAASFVAGLVAAGLAGCDYVGAGASGTVSLAPEIDASSFQTLALRAFADPSSAFRAGQPIVDGDAAELSLASFTFPFPYEIGGEINHGTQTADWILVAWLSHRAPGAIDRIESGDVYGAIRFRIGSCPGGGQYCGITPHVDCTITTVAP